MNIVVYISFDTKAIESSDEVNFSDGGVEKKNHGWLSSVCQVQVIWTPNAGHRLDDKSLNI